jgi:hypothetical protein
MCIYLLCIYFSWKALRVLPATVINIKSLLPTCLIYQTSLCS